MNYELGFKVFRAIFARLLFAVHGLTAVWRAAYVQKNDYFYLFAVPIILMFIEGAIRIVFFDSNESLWFCASIFLFLSGVVPSLWLLQLHKADLVQANFTIDTRTERNLLDMGLGSLEVAIPIDLQTWIVFLQQTLVVILILGRWILPRGHLSRDHLSQMLLVWIAVGADIVDLYDILKLPEILRYMPYVYLTLGVWSASLLQFPIQISGYQARRARSIYVPKERRRSTLSPKLAHSVKQNGNARNGITNGRSHYVVEQKIPSDPTMCGSCLRVFKDIQFLSTGVTMCIQDISFLVLRLFFLAKLNLTHYSMIYFTCKNALVLLLQLYRLYGILAGNVEAEKRRRTRKWEQIQRMRAELKTFNSAPP